MKRALVLLTALILLAALTLSGCASSKAGTALTAADILGKSYDAMQAAKSFHFLLAHEGGGTPIGSGIEMTDVDGDIVRPDKLSAEITGTFMGSTVNASLVTVGDVTMMTNPMSGKWEVLPASFKVLAVFDPGTGIGAIVNGLTGAALLAEEKIGDVLCYHIKGDIATPALAPLTGTTAKDGTVAAEVWVTKDSFTVQQIKLTGKITDTEKDGIVRTLTISAYDKDVTIALPA
jgi:hypothetical protein